jgi:HD-GYP domain-containing protein (c-di-GMP phosphodiesterase class II)
VSQPLVEALRYRAAQRQCWKAAEQLVDTLEARSEYRKNHARRVCDYASIIGRCLGLSEDEITTLKHGAVLHDIGEITLAPSLFEKPAELSDSERQILRAHPVTGEQIVTGIEALAPLGKIIRHHHEHWDGRGYPDGLKSERIPLEARIIGLADAFDAITSDRPYRPAHSPDFAISEIQNESGRQFDPDIARACAEAFREAMLKQAKTQQPPQEQSK